MAGPRPSASGTAGHIGPDKAGDRAGKVLAAVLDIAPAAIVCLDRQRRVTAWSRGAELIFGRTAVQAAGRRYDFVPREDKECFDALVARALAGETLRNHPIRHRRKSGEIIGVNLSAAPLGASMERAREIVLAVDDISERQSLAARFEENREQLDAALNNISQGLAMFDSEQRLILSNRLYAEMYGLTAEQVRPGTTVREILQHRLAAGCYRADDIDRLLRDFGKVVTSIQRLADGRIVRVSCRRAMSGNYVITHEDVSDRENLAYRLEQQHRLLQEQQSKLRAQNVQLDAALNNMVQGLAMFDADLRIVVANERYARMYGLTPDQVVPGTPLRSILEHRIARGLYPGKTVDDLLAPMLNRVTHREVRQYVTELGDGRFISVSIQPTVDGGTVTTHQDITEQRRSEARIVYMALHDALTRLPNRNQLNERLEQALTRVKRGESVATHLLDLDHFKSVNDTLGHHTGDKLLKMVADRLRLLVRETDTVARMGGDEFAVVQVAISQPADATSLAHRIIEAVSEPYEIDGHQIIIGTSVGIAIGPEDGLTPDQLIRNADLALYRAKGDSRGTYCFFEREMDAQMQLRRAMEYDLRRALAAGEFELHYQPVVNVHTRQITSFEALLRWNDPKRGLMTPDKFIPLAEEIGLTIPLGEWAVREACSTAAKWPKPLRIAVNLSPAQFRSQGLTQSIAGALAASGLDAGRLELEITEGAFMGENEATLRTLHQLRATGVRITMDDFGTGYSSLSYLQCFPFDRIKIDGSFVRDIKGTAASLNIIRAVAAMATGLGMTTTAEGVETEEQLEAIKSEGCTEMQGFLVSHPRPAREIGLLLGAQPGLPASNGAAVA